jgi:predicted hydrocarbon binding protein
LSYLPTLDILEPTKLETLAENERLPASELIRRMVKSHLDSVAAKPNQLSGAITKRNPNVVGEEVLPGRDEEERASGLIRTDRRAFVMSAHAWSAVEQLLFLNLLEGAAPLLTAMGIAFGRALALDYGIVTVEPQNIRSYFEYLDKVAGWGKFVLTGDGQNESRITVRVRDCAFCGNRSASVGRKEPCSFPMGVYKGIADTIFDSSHFVYETKCCAKGDGFCEITIGKEANPERRNAEWYLARSPFPVAARR